MDQQAAYERARLSRDARFDGRFFIGVTTTGIYCRPVCPAVPPRSNNVIFFPSAAAAGEAGFRPCLRCRPECAPGTPAWNGSSTTVSRGLRLIAAGALDEGSVEQLAERLGVTSRHLRRLFLRHVGASPLTVASTQRLHAAKRLLDETDLPLNRVAVAAGYGSVRRFNAAFRDSYGRSPRELRRTSTRRAASAGVLAIKLPWREPFDWQQMLDFLGARLTAGVETISGLRYLRTVRLDGTAAVIDCGPAARGPGLEIRIHGAGTASLLPIVQRVRELFDLDAPVAEIAAVLGEDELLAGRLSNLPGVRVPGAWDPFELAVRAILGQQVSVRAATTLAGRLAHKYGERLDMPEALGSDVAPAALCSLFPEPARLERARLEKLGVVSSRAATIRRLSRAVVQGEVSFDAATEPSELVEALCALPGIGDWTAQYVAMRAAKDPDAFPVTDLGLLRASGMRPAELRRRAETWRPWRAYAAMLLWGARPDSGG